MDPLQHVYETEDAETLRRILGQQYHVVVGNPPYITVSDSALNPEYRKRFGSCHRQYSIAVPFMERFFHLAVNPGGWVGMITANSFMKREFGRKLIQEYIPKWDLTHVIDTSRAHIPGHGTPTVILLGRRRDPVNGTVRAVMGIRGEPTTPLDPARGLVWTAIKKQVDYPGSESSFVSVADVPRAQFHRHPWSVGGGGVADIKELIDKAASTTLSEFTTAVGFYQATHADEAFVQPVDFVRRHQLSDAFKGHIRGEEVRDWSSKSVEMIFFHTTPSLRNGQKSQEFQSGLGCTVSGLLFGAVQPLVGGPIVPMGALGSTIISFPVIGRVCRSQSYLLLYLRTIILFWIAGVESSTNLPRLSSFALAPARRHI
jgi:hypothetical protein